LLHGFSLRDRLHTLLSDQMHNLHQASSDSGLPESIRIASAVDAESASSAADLGCDAGCFEASITLPPSGKDQLTENLSAYLQDAYTILDALIVESRDPVQRSQLARLARSLYKAIDASSVI
jgi:hypothetical protein